MMHALDEPFDLSPEAGTRFAADGCVHLDRIVAEDIIRSRGERITQCVLEANPSPMAMQDRSTYDRAFLQAMNLWQEDDMVREFVFGKRLARVAAQLMGVQGVRLYHDQALYKEPSGGHTPWHADQYYWPLETDRCCTAWIPLQDTPGEMGPLSFSMGSHRAELSRDIPISDESEGTIQTELDALALPMSNEPYAQGDVSFHLGWTFHRAGPNTTDRPRRVMTIIYMDATMRLAEPTNENRKLDRETWCPGVRVGDVIDSPLNPVLYSA